MLGMNIQLFYQSIAQMSDNQQCTVLGVILRSFAMDDILNNILYNILWQLLITSLGCLFYIKSCG